MRKFAKDRIWTLTLLSSLALYPVAGSAEPFNGLYVGAEAGYDDSQIDVDVDDVDLDISEGDKGLAYGAFAGINFKINRSFVIGAEADISLNDSDFEFDDDITVFDVDAGRTLGLSGRAGFLLGENIMIYGKGGYVSSRFTISDGFADDKKNFNGWRFGGGIEVALLDPISFRLEYTYTDYENKDIEGLPILGTSEFDRGRLMAGVALNF